MNIEILDFNLYPCKTKLADVVVRYEEIILRCELVYHVGSHKAWIRMPEIWKTQNFKKKFAYWPTKELSEEFQKCALSKIFEKYDLDVDKLATLHGDKANNRKEIKNV